MRYMFLIYSLETAEGPTPEQSEGLMRDHGELLAETAQKGVLIGAEKLRQSMTATTVRIKDGRAMATDGPFAETKEQLAGYYVLECQDLDEAIEWAKKIPTSCGGEEGCVEIRPIYPLPTRI